MPGNFRATYVNFTVFMANKTTVKFYHIKIYVCPCEMLSRENLHVSYKFQLTLQIN